MQEGPQVMHTPCFPSKPLATLSRNKAPHQSTRRQSTARSNTGMAHPSHTYITGQRCNPENSKLNSSSYESNYRNFVDEITSGHAARIDHNLSTQLGNKSASILLITLVKTQASINTLATFYFRMTACTALIYLNHKCC